MMSRLVKQNENGTLYSANGYQCLEKLKHLEDLEDELGCPLDVVFKALKYGIIDEENEDRDIMIVHSKQGYWFREFSEDLPKLWVKDYKQTWWLKEDLSE